MPNVPVNDIAPRFDYFEPAKGMHGLACPLDSVTNSLLHGGLAGAGNLDFFVDVVCHETL